MNESFEKPQSGDNKSKSEHNAVGRGPETIDFSEDDWESFLSENLENFSGNKRNAAKLLHEWANGMKYVRDKLSAKGLRIEIPTPIVLVREEGCPHPIGHISCFVFVKKSFLERCSKLDMSAIHTVTRADGEVAYEGTIPNLLRLAGVEEFHHEVYEQYKGKQNGDDPLKKSIAEYDADDHEFRALKWQAWHALEVGMDGVTIEKLKSRVADASEVRRKS